MFLQHKVIALAIFVQEYAPNPININIPKHYIIFDKLCLEGSLLISTKPKAPNPRAPFRFPQDHLNEFQIMLKDDKPGIERAPQHQESLIVQQQTPKIRDDVSKIRTPNSIQFVPRRLPVFQRQSVSPTKVQVMLADFPIPKVIQKEIIADSNSFHQQIIAVIQLLILQDSLVFERSLKQAIDQNFSTLSCTIIGFPIIFWVKPF